MAYGRSKNLVATADSNGVIQSVDRQEVTSTNNWATKGRYDRFLSENNVAYASTQWAGDKIAGKTVFGGGQVGYSRQLRKDKWNLVLAELGYDFSYERYVQQPNKTIDPVTIHSARILVGETLSLTSATGLTASVEALFNLNHETKAYNANDGSTGVDAFHDTRINGKLGLSTNLFKKLALGISFTIKYDQNPAPRPVPSVVLGRARRHDCYPATLSTSPGSSPTRSTRSPRSRCSTHSSNKMGTLGGFPSPPAMVRGEQSSPAPHAARRLAPFLPKGGFHG